MFNKTIVEIPSPRGCEYINPEDIICIKADNKSICLCFDNKTIKTVKLSMTEAEKIFSHVYFVRCHRCHIINILKIRERNRKKASIKLVNNVSIPVSDSYKRKLEIALREFCKNWM
jgi:DNA-binding LytR/AlgR family response regulator